MELTNKYTKKYIGLFLLAILLLLFDLFIRLLIPTGFIDSIEVNRSVIKKATLSVGLTQQTEKSTLKIYRVSPLGHRTNLAVIPEGAAKYVSSVDDKYVSGFVIKMPLESYNKISDVVIKIGSGSNKLINALEVSKLRSDINDKEISLFIDSVNSKTGNSIFPYIRTAINYQGDFISVLQSIWFVLFFSIICLVLFILKRLLLKNVEKNFFNLTVSFVLLVIGNFILSWKLVTFSYNSNAYWFFLIRFFSLAVAVWFSLQYRSKGQIIENKSGSISPFLIVILVVAAYLRVMYIDRLSLTTDEIYIGISVKRILETGLPVMPDGTFYGRGLPHVYLSALLSKLPYISLDTAVRLPSVFAGIATVYLVFRIVQRYRTLSAAWIASIFIALFPWTVEFSRWGRMYSLTAFLILLTVYLSAIYIKTGHKLLLVGIISTIILSVMTDIWGYFTVLVFLFSLVFRLSTIKDLFYKNRVRWVGAGILLICAIGVAIFYTELFSSYIVKILSYVQQFSFSEYFLHFFLYYFGLLFVSVLFLFQRKEKEIEFLGSVTVAFLLFVVFYHLHEVPRYLFPVTVIFITSAFIGLDKIIRDKLWFAKRGEFLSALILLLFSLSYLDIGYTLSIPFREHGDRYTVDYYAPTTVSDYIADYESNNLEAAKLLTKNDILLTNHFQYTYYYIGKEPDYWLRPGRDSYFSNRDGTVKYMKTTKVINDKKKLISVLKSNDFSQRIIIVFNLKGGHQESNLVVKNWIENELAGYYIINKAFIGDEKGSLLYIGEPN